jgi:hypothetical protein
MPEDKDLPATQQGDESSQISSPQHGVAREEIDALLGHRNVDRFLALLEKKAEYDYEIGKEKNANEKQSHENMAHYHRNVEYRLVTERKMQRANSIVGCVFLFLFFAVLAYGIYSRSSVQWGYIPLWFIVLSTIVHYLNQYFSNKKK